MGTTQPRAGAAGRSRRRGRDGDHPPGNGNGNGGDPGTGPHADPESVARKILLDRLSAQPRTRAELAETLAKKLVPNEVARRLLDRFEEVGLVDDAAFARSWVESRQVGRGLARRALAQELRRKGVPDDVARDALDDVDPEDETEVARGLVRRKLRSMGRLDRRTRMRRLTAMLARKGFPPGVAMGVVRDALDDAEAFDEGLDAAPEETGGLANVGDPADPADVGDPADLVDPADVGDPADLVDPGDVTGLAGDPDATET